MCGSSALTKVIDLGEQYLQGSFVKPGKELPSMRKIPLTLVRCDPTKDEIACGLLQMEHTVPAEVLYSNYWYRSGTNNTMRQHLKGLAEEASSIFNHPKAKVLDIGCNDGTLLKCYPNNFEKYGVDPSDIAQEINEQFTIIQDIFPSQELETKLGKNKIDIITSIAMFYDLEDPIGFTKGIKNYLSLNGIWIFEMSYMPAMLKMNSYDTICHEHLEYYSLAVIEFILSRAGMKIFNVNQNSINGGSIRCYATHINNNCYKKPQFESNLRMMRNDEFDLSLDLDLPYKDFQESANLNKKELLSLLIKLKNDGKSIHIYGASTKGNTILQWCGIDFRLIEAASERNPDKYGAKTLGTDIPIISEAESRAMNPDYYLVLPWHFKEEFIEREKVSLDKGVGFIFPLPNVEIIKK